MAYRYLMPRIKENILKEDLKLFLRLQESSRIQEVELAKWLDQWGNLKKLVIDKFLQLNT